MSNILIIKHGSLGDIAQASGAIQDISEYHSNDDVYLLTTKPYFELFKTNPYLKAIILDKRLSRFNLIYLFTLMRVIKKYKFAKVFDLQNSSRTNFYKRILFPNANHIIWSSSDTTLPKDISKKEFDKNPVLDRFKHQLETSGIKTNNVMTPNFNWACQNIDEIKHKYKLNKYIILFPFCSPHLAIKKWPHYNKFIDMVKNKFKEEFQVVVAPGPLEIPMTKDINAVSILNNGKALTISELATLIKDSSYVIANDTGPAHMAAHLGVKGLTLFGSHTTAYKVSIERKNFKAIQVADLNKLTPEKVFEKFTSSLN
jgi:ADP-heptose:LPS heptosyltransferase